MMEEFASAARNRRPAVDQRRRAGDKARIVESHRPLAPADYLAEHGTPPDAR